MKRALLAQRLPHLLLGGVLTALLVASAVVLPAPPAQAADQYFYDFFLSEDLSYKDSFFVREMKDLSKSDSEIICEKDKTGTNKELRKSAKEDKEQWGISHRQIDNCRFQGSYFFLDSSGKYDEKLLERATSDYGLKINSSGELVMQTQILEMARHIRKVSNKHNIGFARFVFPGKIKSVTPNIGKVSGNTFTLDKPLTSEERTKVLNSEDTLTITAERHGSNLGLILGITIPAALIIVAVIVLLIVRNNRKKKHQHLPPYPTGYGTYPPPPFMPGNSANPVQSQVSGYPAGPGAPGMPGAASYPPNVPPPGQPGAPTRGGYNPYPYPYPPANPQGSPVRYSMPNQAYGTPTPGFPPPAAPPQPAAGQQESPDDSNQANPTEQPGQVN